MLTIDNITKVYKKDVGEWRIGKVETLPSAYLFTLYKFNRREQIQINLERIAIGVQYELWRWNSYGNQSPHPNSVPMRRMLDRTKLETPDSLVNEIKELMYK
jgi:hypothetical protein